jgi:hypothetical protein
VQPEAVGRSRRQLAAVDEQRERFWDAVSSGAGLGVVTRQKKAFR